MSNSPFIQVDSVQTAEQACPAHLLKGKPAYAAVIKSFTSEGPEQYEDGAKVNSSPGVVVPVSDIHGMIRNDPNPYGRIVVGKVIGREDKPVGALGVGVLEQRVAARAKRYAKAVPPENPVRTQVARLPNTISELTEVLPQLEGPQLKLALHKLERLMQERDAGISPDSAQQEAEVAVHSGFLQEEVAELLEAATASEAAPVSSAPALARVSPVPAPAPVLPKPAAEPISVRIEGKFGRCSAKFLAVEQHDNQLVLVYAPTESIFIPAANGEPFNVQFQDRTLVAENVGIEFNLDFLNMSVLVFLIKEI